jgi:hypothetical protein
MVKKEDTAGESSTAKSEVWLHTLSNRRRDTPGSILAESDPSLFREGCLNGHRKGTPILSVF